MALYHFHADLIRRSAGQSVVAAAAYRAGEKLHCDYYGNDADYTRKKGVVLTDILLPPYAPPEYTDRETLWNAVEANEKTKDSQLAREFIVALPVELGKRQWVGLVSEFIQDNFASDGMCADVAIHDPDGHNPHAHILLTMRPLNEDGTWQYKTEKEYLCVRDGEERGFTAAEFKTAQSEGWEKQYPYKVGNMVNLALERAGRSERIDHRSHAERGLDEKPTMHEGVSARKMEAVGHVAERCKINRQIRVDNALIHAMKATIVKLKKAVETTIPAIAAAMETVRRNIIVFQYGVLFVRGRRKDTKEYVEKATHEYGEYKNIRVREKGRERDETGRRP